MTTFTGGRYGYAPDEYDEEPITELHPRMKREAIRIARRDMLWRLRQFWLSAIGVLALIGSVASLILVHLGLFITGVGVLLVSCLATLYLLSLAMRPGRG
jgi:Flp pilus assembly protein TadB